MGILSVTSLIRTISLVLLCPTLRRSETSDKLWTACFVVTETGSALKGCHLVVKVSGDLTVLTQNLEPFILLFLSEFPYKSRFPFSVFDFQ